MLALVLGLSLALLAHWVNSRATLRMLDSTADTAAFYLQSLIQPHVQSLATGDKLTRKDHDALVALADSFRSQGQFLAIKVWYPDGELAFAPAGSGAPEHSPDEIAAVMRGEVVGRFSDLETGEHATQRALGVRLYEIYAPLFEADTGRILAVGEFYQNADHISHALIHAAAETWRTFVPVGLAMFLLLFLVVRRGSRTIEFQTRALERRLVEQARLHHDNEELRSRINDATRKAAAIDELRHRRLGADLHDGAGQLLAYMLLRLDRLDELIRAGAPQDLRDAREIAGRLRAAAQQALEEIRSVSSGLSAPFLSDARTLRAALEGLAQVHEQRTGTRVDLKLDLPERELPPELLGNLGRIAQEALGNAARHAGSTQREIRAHEEAGRIVMIIADDGIGPGETADPERAAGSRPKARGPEASGGLGIPGMRFRAESHGGELEIRARRPRGTEVICRVPLPRSAEDPALGKQ
ncbi:sensor histidine kinase [Acidimangrovimonas sediminis]|uniref:sensor histidine kinase n=1 Tax=Acidimangrovimonas sediminis TaxID=2056283 RepID=UPI001304C233|nr:ATP-binding protein [Acidimangrovimonas sediminis]